MVHVFNEGSTSHASRPWEGTNAFDVLLGGIQKLLSAKHPSKDKLVFDNSDSGSGWKTTLTVTDIRRVAAGEAGRGAGGASADVVLRNTIPDVAVAEVAIRFTDEWNEKSLLRTIKSIVKADGDVEVREHIHMFVI